MSARYSLFTIHVPLEYTNELILTRIYELQLITNSISTEDMRHLLHYVQKAFIFHLIDSFINRQME